MAFYNDIKQQTVKSDIILIDNSPNLEEVPETPETIWVGRTNLGFGGCYDFILNHCKWQDYDFVGIYNIDVSIPPDTLEKVFSHDLFEYGIVSPSVDGSGLEHMRNQGKGIREVDFVESICWLIRPCILENLKKRIPLPRRAWLIDMYLATLTKCAVCDDVVVQHGKNDKCVDLMGNLPYYELDALLDACDWVYRSGINISGMLNKYNFFDWVKDPILLKIMAM